MSRFTKFPLYFLSLLIILTGCRKKAFDEFYGRPENLQPPIYQVLSQKGNFTNLLACIDKSGYKPILSASGYWTFFAPNDEAFQKYFTDNNITSIDSTTARKIVTYCLVYNAFQTDHIADYQAPTGWVPSQAFKRKTAYYDGFFIGQGPDGPSTVLLSANRNATTSGTTSTSFVFGDENNKYIPYFYKSFMDGRGLSATDYNYFFPGSTYTDFNVAGASVKTRDILAENGVIHEIDRVILPLPSIEQKLGSNPQYALFKSLFERFLVLYGKDDNATRRYFTQTGKSNSVYIKAYSGLLAYALGNETYTAPGISGDNISQTNGYSMFAPTDAALSKYLSDVVLEFYGTVEKLPASIIADLLNAHLWQTTVWPSKFAQTSNFLGEPARFNAGTDVVDKQFCSNGIFYGTNKVQQANVFSTVYSRSYLDPNYSIMTAWLNSTNGRNTIASTSLKYTIFMLPDVTLRALGYDYNGTNFTYTINGSTTTGGTATINITRIFNMHIVPAEAEGDLITNLAGDGIAETQQGEYIRWHANTVFSAGTVEKNQTLNIIPGSSRTYVNGIVHFLSNNGVMEIPVKTLANDIRDNAGTLAAQRPYFDFYQYLINSGLYDPAAQEILGIELGGNYTILVPTQAAMRQAVVDGILPGTKTGTTFVSFTYAPTLSTDKDNVNRFIQYHILKGIQIAPDGKKSPNGSAFPTLLKNANGDVVELKVFNQPNNLRFEDDFGRSATVTPPNNAAYFPATSNYLGTRTLLHQINNYLKYKY